MKAFWIAAAIALLLMGTGIALLGATSASNERSSRQDQAESKSEYDKAQTSDGECPSPPYIGDPDCDR